MLGLEGLNAALQSLEVLLVQGPAARLHQLCDDLRRIRSVQQIKLVTTTALLMESGHGEAAWPRPTPR